MSLKTRYSKGFAPIVFAVVLALVSTTALFLSKNNPTSAVNPIIGLGIAGDSQLDEYRADDNRGTAFQGGAYTFNIIELLEKKRGINIGPWDTRPSPRRIGYEYNWALSGATSTSLISSGQHTGLKNQIGSGQVSHVFFHIGDNDIVENNLIFQIYNGSLTPEQTSDHQNRIATNIENSVNVILAPPNPPQGMIMTGLIDAMGTIMETNELKQYFPNPEGRARVKAFIVTINQRLEQFANTKGIVYKDYRRDGLDVIQQRADAEGFIVVGGERIDPFTAGDEPHHAIVGGNGSHPGTVIAGLLANLLIIGPMNERYGASIAPFTDEEILVTAGILQPTPLPTVVPTPTLTPMPTPTPTPVPSPTVTPTSQTLYPSSYSVTAGTLMSGNLASLNSNDNKYLVTKSVTSGSNRVSAVEVTFSGISNLNPSSLSFTYIGKSNGAGRTFWLYLFNQNTGAWDTISTFSVGASEVTRNQVVSQNIVNYINPSTSSLRFKVVAGITGQVTTTASHEMIKLVTNP